MVTPINMLPKAELHCHLDGSISLNTIRKLAAMEEISLPEEGRLRELTTVPPDCRSLKQYLNCFGLAF